MTSARAPAPVHEHTRKPYAERATRYATAADRLAVGGLCDLRTVADIGAGYTDLDYLLRSADHEPAHQPGSHIPDDPVMHPVGN